MLLVDAIDYNSHFLEYIGSQIKKHDPKNLEYINSLILSFSSEYSGNDNSLRNSLFWSNDKMNIVVSNEKGIMNPPIDISDRDYLRKSKENPENIKLGKLLYGRVSKEWVIPTAMGIIDNNNKYIGSLIFGFKFRKLKEKIIKSVNNNNVLFAVFDYDNTLIISSDEFSCDKEMNSLIAKAIKSTSNSGELKDFLFFKNQENYGFYKKNDKHSYIILTKYNKSFFDQRFKNIIYSCLVEICILFIILGLIFYILKVVVFRPITLLSTASKLITQNRDGETIMPKTRIIELRNLINQLNSIKEYKNGLIGAKQSQERFFANMSHELRTPLNGILNFSAMMHKEMLGELSDEYKEMASDIHVSGTHLLKLVDDILDFSKMDLGEMKLKEEEFSIITEVEEAIKLSKSGSKIDITYNIDSSLSKLRGDKRMFRQILLNLFSNSLKHTLSGNISLEIFPEKKHLVVKLKDTGIGIKEEDLLKLSEEFGQVGNGYSRGKCQGKGLGLFLVKKMLELHQGNFEITSIYGEGTVVKVTFPINRIVKSK